MGETLLEVKELRTSFFTERGVAPAVDGISFTVGKGRVLGIVGESGSGKSVTSLSVMRLLQEPAGKIMGGQILFKGQDLTKLTDKQMQKIRGSQISMVFQEPMTALNPVYTVGDQIAEVYMVQQKLKKKEAWAKATEMMGLVGIPSPEERMKVYPHQMSGGMRQRVVIAMALACRPDLIIADEPTTALDVTIQAKILDEIKEIKRKQKLSVIFITHDLGVVANMADRICVMYAGKIVEVGTAREIFYSPAHPYTWALLSSMPDLETKERLFSIPGTPPNMIFPPKGDAFAERNQYAMQVDFEEEPPFFKLSDTHYAATWLLHPNAPKVEMPEALQHRIARMNRKEGV